MPVLPAAHTNAPEMMTAEGKRLHKAGLEVRQILKMLQLSEHSAETSGAMLHQQ
jgi:hypothetical protein